MACGLIYIVLALLVMIFDISEFYKKKDDEENEDGNADDAAKIES